MKTVKLISRISQQIIKIRCQRSWSGCRETKYFNLSQRLRSLYKLYIKDYHNICDSPYFYTVLPQLVQDLT